MDDGEWGAPVVWYMLPDEEAESLLLYADRLMPGEAGFPVAVRVSMNARLGPARIAAALRRMAEAIEGRYAVLEEVDATWCVEVRMVGREEKGERGEDGAASSGGRTGDGV
jgi:hypothetical protein